MDIPSLIAELTKARATLVAPLEGLLDLSSLNLKPDTKSAVIGLQLVYQRRDRLLQRAIAALRDLYEDGYPSLPQGSMSELEYNDLLRNQRTIGIGIGLFAAEDESASTVTIVVGEPEPKP